MEEVINKSDGQFKVMLDEIIDYNKHASEKDPLIKELSRPIQPAASQLPSNKPPAASLNSSTYSSAASSSASSTSSNSCPSVSSSSSSSSSSSTSSSASDSSTSSTSSSPSQSCQPGPSSKDAARQSGHNSGNLEIPKMELLGKKAEILENFRSLPPSVLTASSSCTSTNNAGSTSASSSNTFNLSQTNSAQRYTAHGGSLVQLNSHGIATTSAADIISESSTSSWKTIGKRDKRRKKPAEKKILAQDIPGYIGDRTVEELEKFIKSGTNGTSNSSNSSKNNKSKPQNNSNGTSNSSNHHHNIGSNNSTNSSNNSSSKKNDSQPLNNYSNSNKTHLMSSKMTNNIQSKTPPQSIQSQQPAANNNSASTNSTTVTINNTTTNINTASQIYQTQMQPKQSQNQGDSNHQVQSNNKSNKPLQQLQHQHTKYSPNLATRQSQPNQRRLQQQQHQIPQQQQQPSKQQSQVSQKSQEQAAVTFANHIKVRDENVNKYIFGFFDEEQPNQTQHAKLTDSSTHNSHADNSKKQTSQVQQPIQNEHKQKSKQSKTSPNTEENCCKSADKIDANSFNYEQVLKFISNAWENTKARKEVASHGH